MYQLCPNSINQNNTRIVTVAAETQGQKSSRVVLDVFPLLLVCYCFFRTFWLRQHAIIEIRKGRIQYDGGWDYGCNPASNHYLIICRVIAPMMTDVGRILNLWDSNESTNVRNIHSIVAFAASAETQWWIPTNNLHQASKIRSLHVATATKKMRSLQPHRNENREVLQEEELPTTIGKVPLALPPIDQAIEDRPRHPIQR